MRKLKWVGFVVLSMFILAIPLRATATVIHQAFYDWYDTDADLDIDYVVVTQTTPIFTQYVVDLDAAQPNDGGLLLVEIIEKYFDEDQGNHATLPDFQWIVMNDNLDTKYGYEISSFHVPNFGFTATWEWNDIGGDTWSFSQAGDMYEWQADPGDTLIDGDSGDFRVAGNYTDWGISTAILNYVDSAGDTQYLVGVTSHPTPEPTSLILLGLGLFGLLGLGLRKHS